MDNNANASFYRMAILIWVLAIHPSVLHRLVCLKLKGIG